MAVSCRPVRRSCPEGSPSCWLQETKNLKSSCSRQRQIGQKIKREDSQPGSDEENWCGHVTQERDEAGLWLYGCSDTRGSVLGSSLTRCRTLSEKRVKDDENCGENDLGENLFVWDYCQRKSCCRF